jgi:hypothetical protein
MGHDRVYIQFYGLGQASFVACRIDFASLFVLAVINLLQAVLESTVDKVALKVT